MKCTENGLSVLLLIVTFQFEVDASKGGCIEFFSEVEWGVHIVCLDGKDGACLGQSLTHHDGHMGLDDAGFLAGYALKGVAQKLCVVETDVGDDTQDGGDDVGTVKPSAHAYFYHSVIDMLFGKILEGHSRSKLEKGRVEGFEEGTLLFHEVDDILLWYALTVDADALSEVYQMR